MKISKQIPNFITCLNLLSGCFFIYFVLKGNLPLATFFIIPALILDFLDGLTARLLNAYSPFGKELDSFADMVSFGFAPGILLHITMKQYVIGSEINGLEEALSFFPFLIIIFSGIRLAKFNVDTKQEKGFIGLPTPANAILITSIALLIVWPAYAYPQYIENEGIRNILTNIYFIPVFSLVSAFMLIMPLPLMAFKFGKDDKKKILVFVSFILVSLLAILSLRILAIPLIILIYFVLSIIDNISKK